MRKQLFLLLLLMMQFTLAQVVSIGTGTNDDGLPVDPYYKYSYSQCLYLASEINQSGNIYRIKYKGKPNLDISNSNEWIVYIGHTSNTTLTSNVWIPVSQMTQVFSGTVSVVDNNVEVILTTPFNYNGTDNLIIAIDENKTGYDSSTNDFYSTDLAGVNTGNTTDIRSKLFKDDNTNPDPSNPPGNNVIKQGSVANIDFDFNATVCNIPTALSASNITATSADLGWTAGGSETTWNIEYGVAGFTQGNGTSISNVSNNSYSLSGLVAASTYDVYVQANCGSGTSAWVSYTFSTACDVVTSFNENFDAIATYALPNCWSAITDNGASSSAQVSAYAYSSPNSGTKHLRMYNATSAATSNIILVSPKLSNLSSGTHRLRFYAKNSTDTQDLEVGTISNSADGSTFTSLQSVDIDGAYKEYIVNFDTYSGTDTYIAIRRLSTSTYTSVLLDDIVWEEIPSCPKPNTLTASNITATSADLGWTAGGSETTWNIEYGATGFTQGSGTMVTGITTNPHSLTGLTGSTTYDFYVQADCGSGDTSTWEGPFSFTTACSSITTFPYTEEFEGITSGQPLCWGIAGTTSINGYHWRSYTVGNQGRGVRFNSYSNLNGRTSELTTPTIDLTSLSAAELKFEFKNPTGGNFEVLISTDGGSNYTSLESGLTNQTDWIEKTYDVTSYIGSNVKIQFKGTSNYGNGDAYIYLDKVQVKERTSLSVNELNVKDLKGVQIYPNPFQDVVNISDIKGVEKISIIDMSGRVVETFAPAHSLNLSGLNGGMYLINLSYEDSSVKTLKAIKK